MKNTARLHLHEMSKVVKFIKSKTRMMVAGAKGKGKQGSY